jgi:molecular chaperone HtpG
MTEKFHSTKYEFKAEVKKLLNILVHSLYTSKEIFLRELISNASDALDKIRFELNKNSDIADSELPLEVKIEFDEKKKIILVTDTGIGMTRDEVITNIGTIAKSSTEEFIKLVSDAKDYANNIIGRFGVGFYSVFMVAKEVIIRTKSYKKDEPAVEWRSDGLGNYEISELKDNIKRGTRIEIHLRDDASEFAEKWKLEQIIKKHSSFISFPIYVGSEKINTISALWREPKNLVTKEKYNEFYKFLTYDNNEPLDVIHKLVDAPIQFNALLFIPSKSFEYFWMDRENYGLDLYVRRVLIQHKNKDLLPEYLSFVKGVVDSEDLPLNISRETLQENVIFSKIASSVTATVLSYLLDKAKNDKDGYEKFWKEHSRIFKLGYGDFVNHDKYTELLRFNSSSCKEKEELISLADYVSRVEDGQKEIFYLSGQNRDAILSDPHLEIFKKKGLEVLFMFDPIDEFVVSSLRKYKDFEFKSVLNAELKKLEKIKDWQEENKKFEDLSRDDEKHLSSLLSKMKMIIGDKIVDVRLSRRLVDSASCLVSEGDEISAAVQKILKMTNQNIGAQKRIMEINQNHALIRNLLKVYKTNVDDEFIKQATEQLYESALLQEGNLDDPHELVKKINIMLEKSSEWYCQVKNIT